MADKKVEARARYLLQQRGIQGVKFVREERAGSDTRLVYTNADGSEVIDAPGVLVSAQGQVRLVPWTEVIL